MKSLVTILAVLSVAAIILAISQGAFTRQHANPVLPDTELPATNPH